MANLFPPNVDALDAVVEIGDFVLLRDMMEFSDLDGNELSRFRIRDNGALASSGQFTVNGDVIPANTWVGFSADLLLEARYQAGIAIGQESFSIQVQDTDENGNERWSQVDTGLVFTVAPNLRPPVVTAADTSVLEQESVLLTDLFEYSDPEGSPATRFLIVDRSFNANGGHFLLDGVRLQSAQWHLLEADQIGGVEYVSGEFGPQTENLSVRAFDGRFWSAIDDFAVTTTQNVFRPVVATTDQFPRINTVLSAEALFTFSDQDGNTPKVLEVLDTGVLPTGGAFFLNGVRQAAQTWISVPWENRADLEYRAAGVADSERFLVRVSDGRFFSTASASTITTLPRPILEPVETNIVLGEVEEVSAFSLIDQTDGGPLLQTFEVIDLSDGFSGSFRFNNQALDPNEVHTFTRDEFANVTFRTSPNIVGRSFDTVAIRGRNGDVADDGFWTEWAQVDISSDPVGTVSLASGTQVNRFDGEKHQISYYFIGDLPGYYDPANDPDVQDGAPIAASQRALFREAFDHVETFIDVEYTQVTSPFLADVVIGSSTQNGSQGFAFFPFQANGTSGIGTRAEDIFLSNVGPTDPANPDNTIGGFGYLTILHEIGHTLGLDHPFNEPNRLPLNVEDHRLTIMSNNGSPTHPEEATTFQLWDIARLQEVYPANTDFESGDTHWFFARSDNNLQTLWDGGGTDTLNYSNQVISARIDLRNGRTSSLNGQEFALRIAYGANIENARGSQASDEITGNQTRNRLFGNAGNDDLIGLGGNDILLGGAGDDTYIFNSGDGNDIIREAGSDGIDVLQINDFTGDLDSLENDFIARVIGGNLRLDLTLNGEQAQGSVIIEDFGNSSSEVEILRLFGQDGEQVGEDIELSSVFLQSDAQARRFQVTDFFGTHGFLAAPV